MKKILNASVVICCFLLLTGMSLVKNSKAYSYDYLQCGSKDVFYVGKVYSVQGGLTEYNNIYWFYNERFLAFRNFLFKNNLLGSANDYMDGYCPIYETEQLAIDARTLFIDQKGKYNKIQLVDYVWEK